MSTAATTDPTQGDETGEAPSLAFTIALHLVPGAIFAGAYVVLASPLRQAGVPPIGTFVVLAALVLVPLELGYLLHRGHRLTGRWTLAGVIGNTRPLPARSYALWIPALYAVSFVLFMAVGTVTTGWLRETFFSWVPSWMDDPLGLDDPGRYGSTAILLSWVGAVAINGLLGPAVEELYFRGHLLPRLAPLGRWAPAVNSALFALYHFVSPWQFFARALGLLPLFYFVWHRRNLYVAMAVHCALNTVAALLLLPRLLNTV